MTMREAARRVVFAAGAVVMAVTLASCSSGMSMVSNRTQGYDLNDDAVSQVRVGQSQDLVTTVLGSPQTTNTFGDTTAFYYIETKVQQTAFGMNMSQERTVLAIYFDKNQRVSDKAVYSAKDGKIFTIESRRTASFGEDKTFLESIMNSLFTG